MSDENQATESNELDSVEVEKYLKKHPEFFHNHVSLLESLSIPHPSGNAVSLISKQLELFRSKHQELENQLTGLIDIAKDNDTSFNRMHELTLALMEAKTVEGAVENLDKVFVECFLTDFSAIRIIKDKIDLPMSNIFVHSDDENLHHFDKILASSLPKCGKPTLAQARFLFGDFAKEVKSCAIIPMSFTEIEGVIAIGSRDKNRFHRSMGNLFLTQMSEVIGTRLITLLG
ncbi:MAG: DUF484 family protein [Methylococcales bacterium]|nr:DUF484 family protein [Methylococcales bacterium]